MGYQAVFKRYEIKYMITAEQKQRILQAMSAHMEADRFGRSTIRNIYYDTGDYILARHSIAKPDFKEKLRVRSYSKADAGSTAFVELKRKFDGVVYKRRLGMPAEDAAGWLAGFPDRRISDEAAAESPQVAGEIEYFRDTYSGLRPVLFLSYDREAYRMKKGSGAIEGGADFRVTFDENIFARDHDLSLGSEVYGERILQKGKILMELKCSGGIPMWMAEVLSAEKIYKTSFSKYGTAYQTMIFPMIIGGAAAASAAYARNNASLRSRNSDHGKSRANNPSISGAYAVFCE